MNKICIAGIGPGALDYITPAARKAVENCDILVGGRRNLAIFAGLQKETYLFESNMEEMIGFVQLQMQKKRICVVVSGDPGFYSLLDFFIRKLGRESLQVIPGISSFQYLFCKMVKPWKDYHLASLHGREVQLQNLLESNQGIFLLTDKQNTPSKLAADLMNWGIFECTMVVGENLSYPEERIVIGKPIDIQNQQFDELCVVVIEKDGMAI
jgi:cobalt-precorrin-7 (C5)-methyltransferase